MKRFVKAALAVALSVSMLLCTACGTGKSSTNDGELRYADEQVLHLVYSGELDSLYMENAGTTSGLGGYGPTCTEGLLTRDKFGNLVHGLADSYEVNEDGTVYTFHIRDDLYWVDSKGEKAEKLTANDFVTTAKHICDPSNASNSALFFQGIVKGAISALKGEAEFDGFTAVDEHTLQISLEGKRPYFLDLTVLYVPSPTEYINQVGKDYGSSADKTRYIGAYYISDWQPQYCQIYEKNTHYWDADNVFIEKIEMTYNNEADLLAPQMYKRGDIDEVGLDTSILDEWRNDPETKDCIISVQPSAISRVNYYSFCYAPTFGEDYEQENYLKAINNENFRQSIFWGIDRYRLKSLSAPYETERYLANTITPVGWCSVNGTDYTQFNALKDITNRSNWGFDESKATSYRDKAIKELTAAGATLPVKLYMPYDPDSTIQLNEVQALKQQLESLLGSDYIECVIEAGPASGFTSAVRRTGKYAFMRINNSGNVPDPAQWVVAFQSGNNWTFLDQATGEDLAPQVEAYEKMLSDGWVIGDKSEERYNTYAEAEAYLINHALVVPYSIDVSGGFYKIGRLNPFENVIGVAATYKGMHLYESALTKEQVDKLYEEYLKEKAESTSLS